MKDVARTDFKSVDEYIASQPEAVQGVLERVRRIIRKAVPKAEEVISYQIPAYKLDGRPVLYFAGWRQHYSLYPSTARLVAAFKDDLAPYEVSKGTIRFPLSEPVPVKLIEAVAKFRAREVVERGNAKAAARNKRQTSRIREDEGREALVAWLGDLARTTPEQRESIRAEWRGDSTRRRRRRTA